MSHRLADAKGLAGRLFAVGKLTPRRDQSWVQMDCRPTPHSLQQALVRMQMIALTQLEPVSSGQSEARAGGRQIKFVEGSQAGFFKQINKVGRWRKLLT